MLITLCSAAILAQPLSVAPHTLQQIERLLIEKQRRTPTEGKLSSALLYALKGSPPGVTLRHAERPERMMVELEGEMDRALMVELAALGGEVVHIGPYGRSLVGSIPRSRLMALATMAKVTAIRQHLPPMRQMINLSEGDRVHRADQARVSFGVDGRGVKVCVLSDGVDSLAPLQASGDLPATIDVLPGAEGSGSEGTAMLEIVHDLAPGAALGFATALGGEAQFAANIEQLRFEANCDILVDDIFYFTEAVFQDDIVAEAVDRVSADGALYFSAAGNSGNLNDGTAGVWEGDFSPGGAATLTTRFGGRVAGQLHAFAPNVTANLITRDSPFLYTLQWSDPLQGSANDYDLFLVDPAGNVVAASTNIQNGNDDPFEFIDSGRFDDTGFALLIFKHNAAAARYLHLNSNRGELLEATAGQISGHAAASGAISVAAVDQQMANGGVFDGDEQVELFSSDGPRRIFYRADGSAVTPGNFLSRGGELRRVPTLAAADGVATATPGFNPFFGTSAAAPHAAAIAALALSLDPERNATALRRFGAAGTLDIEDPGVDRDAGLGILDAQALLEAVERELLNGDALNAQPGPSVAVEPSAVALVGDLDRNGCIGRGDLELLLWALRQGAPREEPFDIDSNGVVDRNDVFALLNQVVDVDISCGDVISIARVVRFAQSNHSP